MELISLLESLGSADKSIRGSAESRLRTLETSEGFGANILTVSGDDKLPLGIRQLALTVVKQLVRLRWEELSSTHREGILNALLRLALQINPPIRKLVHSCIAQAAGSKGVSNWPDLIVTICATISSPAAADETKLYVLDLIDEVITESGGSALSKYVAEINAALVKVSGNEHLYCRAFSVFVTLMVHLELDEEYTRILSVDFSLWMECLGSSGPSFCISSKTSILTDMKRLVDHRMLDKILPLVERWADHSILTLQEEHASEQFVVCACELINALAIDDEGSRILSIPRLGAIIHVMVFKYIEVPKEAEDEWLSDVNAFIATEQDDLAHATVRLVFEGLVADLLDHPLLSAPTVSTLIHAVCTLFEANLKDWQKVESGLFAFSLLSSDLISAGHRAVALAIIKHAATACGPGFHPLLRARAFVVLSRVSIFTAENFGDDVLAILKHAVACMADTKNTVVVYASAMAFNAFLANCLERFPNDVMRIVGSSGGAFACFLKLAKSGSHESLHFSLEGLIKLTSSCPQIISAAGEPYFDFLVDLLVAHFEDPLVPTQVLELVQAVLDAVPVMQFDILANRIGRTLRPWIDVQEVYKLDVALEFLEFVVNHASVPFAKDLMDCMSVLGQGEIQQIGPETARHVGDILRVASIRHSAD